MYMRMAVLVFALSAAARADVVHLKNGGKIEGRVTEEGGVYRIDTGHGTVTLPKEDVVRVEPKEFKAPEKPKFDRRPPRLRDSYAHPFYGFRLYLPAGWQKAPDKEPQKLTFVGPKDQLYTPHMTLSVQVTRQDLGDMANSLKTAFLKNYQDVTFPHEEVTSVRGRDALQFLAAFNDGAVRMRSLWTIVRWEERLYLLGFSCSEAWFDRYSSGVDGCMRSLRLFPLPTVPTDKRKEFQRLYQEGYTSAAAGKTAEAASAFGRAAAIIPTFPDIHNIVGRQQVKLKKYGEAEAAFKRALELDPEDYEFNYNLGVALLQQKKYDPAIEALKKAVAADATMEPALTNLGVAYLGKDAAREATEILEKAVVADPESVPAHYNYGVALEESGRKKEAEAQYKETLKLDPKHQGARDGLARLRK